MAGPELKTKDDVPLYELGDFTLELMDVFNEEASRGFIDRFSQEVNSRTFLARTGDMTWDEVAELEHARTGSLEDYQMAFSVATYAKSLGFSREYIEDSPAELVRDHVTELVAGGRQKMFDVVFDVLKTGIADGSTLWYTPQDYGSFTFTDTHDHTYTGVNTATETDDQTRTLFSDTADRSPTEIALELSKELTHHGYDPDTILTTRTLADKFVEERTDGFGSQFWAPRAENLEGQGFPRDGLRVRGMDTMSTAWLQAGEFVTGEHPLFIYDSSVNPVKRNTVRAMEITDNTGAPVGGAGGFRGDPGALLGTFGTMRFGTKFGDPLAGAVVKGVDEAVLTV